MFLSNCDSVRRLGVDELTKRVLIGSMFARGVIATPSLLLDNPHMLMVLERRNLQDWLAGQEGGGLVLRGPAGHVGMRLRDYFDALPPDYILSRCGGRTKRELSFLERRDIEDDLKRLDRILARVARPPEPVALRPNSLTEAIRQGSSLAQWQQAPSEAAADAPSDVLAEPLAGDLAEMLEGADTLNSRSAWYAAAADTFDPATAARFQAEVIDPAYHGLFVRKGEAFAMDRIAVIDALPPQLLDVTTSFRVLRRKTEFIGHAVSLFNLISAAGTNQLLAHLTDEAIGFVEDKMQDKGLGWASRRNWFGLYPALIRKIGVEIR